MEPRTVALVATQRGWRGGEEQAWQLALGLRQRGHCVHLIARVGSPLSSKMKQAEFGVQEFRRSPRGPRTICWMRRTIAALQPDVIHFNDPHALTAAGIACCGLKIPVRVMARRVDFALSSSWRYRSFADRVICVSRAVARVCEEGGVPAQRLAVVYDGVDPQRMSVGNRERGRKSLALVDQETLLLTVAAFSDHKGHRFLLDAMPRIVAHYPQIALALAGDGELEQSLRVQTAALGLSDRVRFLGFRPDVADLIHAADLFVMPSRLEGLCSTLIDVMLAGTPIVATTAGGIPEVLVDPNTGPVAWLVPPENPIELATAIIRAIDNSLGRKKFVELARARALQNFTAEKMVEATIAVYEAALAENT